MKVSIVEAAVPTTVCSRTKQKGNSTMYSKMVTQREKSADALSGVLASHTNEAADLFREMLAPHLDEGDSVPDLAQMQILLDRRLATLRRRLVSADRSHFGERKGDSTLRDERDTAVTELVQLLYRLRNIVDRACDGEVCKDLWGLEGTLPRDPAAVRNVTGRVVEQLRDPSFELPEALPGVALDPTPWIALLEEPLERLDQALKQLAQERGETARSQVSKDEALEDYDRAYQATARLFEDLFRLVGMTKLAGKVRDRRRSPPGSGDEPEDQDQVPVSGLAPAPDLQATAPDETGAPAPTVL
jgi:hypothetical protein